MNRFTITLTALALPVCLSACASTVADYPSLAKRDAERMTGTADPVSAESLSPPAPPLSTQLEERLTQLKASAQRAHTDFLARRGTTERAVAAAGGAAKASESWTQAQVALAGLEAARANALIALADLDQLYVDERDAHPEAPSPSANAIASARDSIHIMVAEENRAIQALMLRTSR